MKKFLLACCLAAVAIMPGYVSAHSHHSHSHHHEKHGHKTKQDPIVGPWVYNFEIAGDTIFGVWGFHADKTFEFHDSGNLTQSLPDVFPAGAYFTIDIGSWERTGKRTYEGVNTAVVLARGFDCASPADLPGCLAAPAVPLFRLKTSFNDFVIDKGGQTASVTLHITVHPVDDLTLTLPAIDPNTGLPVPDSSGTVQLRKVTF